MTTKGKNPTKDNIDYIFFLEKNETENKFVPLIK